MSCALSGARDLVPTRARAVWAAACGAGEARGVAGTSQRPLQLRPSLVRLSAPIRRRGAGDLWCGSGSDGLEPRHMSPSSHMLRADGPVRAGRDGGRGRRFWDGGSMSGVAEQVGERRCVRERVRWGGVRLGGRHLGELATRPQDPAV